MGQTSIIASQKRSFLIHHTYLTFWCNGGMFFLEQLYYAIALAFNVTTTEDVIL
jgi:hypothetical protein